MVVKCVGPESVKFPQSDELSFLMEELDDKDQQTIFASLYISIASLSSLPSFLLLRLYMHIICYQLICFMFRPIKLQTSSYDQFPEHQLKYGV